MKVFDCLLLQAIEKDIDLHQLVDIDDLLNMHPVKKSQIKILGSNSMSPTSHLHPFIASPLPPPSGQVTSRGSRRC